MKVHSICEKYCPNKIPISLGDRIDGGADGELFYIKNEPDKVIKLCVRYNNLFAEDNLVWQDECQQTEKVIRYVMEYKTIPYVYVYAYKHLGNYSRITFGNQEQEFILYYYIMQKLKKTSDDELKIFSNFLPGADNIVKTNFSIEKAEIVLQELKGLLNFDYDKIRSFCENIKKSPVIHQDIHPKNVMADEAGNFYLIDLDRCKLQLNKMET